MLKKLSLSVVLAFSAQFCYSDSITPYYGQTGNAASGGNTWNMDNYFPSNVPGLDVQNVIYNYTIQKQVEDSVTVHVQNENALGSGYIFRESDEWRPGSLGGTEINKVVPVIPNIPRDAWGDGSIVTEGEGSVTDANVIYTYRVDPCYDPQFSPNCPGYVTPQPPEIEMVNVDELYDVTKDEYVDIDRKVDEELIESDEEKTLSEEELAEKEKEEKEKRNERLEKAMAAADNSVMFAQAIAQSQILDSMNRALNMNVYYSATIPGGTYQDSVALVDKQIPENKQGLRNGLAQQLLHEKMIEMQY